MALLAWPFYLLIPTCILIHLFASPYTKVEESFNIQAIHDILIYGIPKEDVSKFFDVNYDHVSFPGSVPRTFLGALILSGLSRPWVGFLVSHSQIQSLVRGILGSLNGLALVWLARSIEKTWGVAAAIWFALLQASQFHVIYYASRTLPNMFALIFSTISLKCLLDARASPWNNANVARKYRLGLYLLTTAGVVFRSELAILVSTITVYLFIVRRISITRIIIPAGLGGLVLGLLCTVPLDSFFWQSFPLWPEWTAFYYNTLLGHSADWGVSPWHTYFTNSLPRLLMNPLSYLLCIPVALMTPTSRQPSLDILIPLLSFVGIYSFLPHKEWRFIIYIVPGLTAVASSGASWIWTRRAKSLSYTFLSLALSASVLLSFIASGILLAISSLNYPGGAAIDFLHNGLQHPPGVHLNAFFDNLACQTGVTRFLEVHDSAPAIVDVLESRGSEERRLWTYSKAEDPELLLDPAFWRDFDYVLAERPEKIIGSWEEVHVIYGYSGIRIFKPGELTSSLEDSPERDLARRIAYVWKSLERSIRYMILRGWWVEISLEPRISILRSQMRNYVE